MLRQQRSTQASSGEVWGPSPQLGLTECQQISEPLLAAWDAQSPNNP